MAKQIILLCIALSLVLSVIAYPSALNYQVGQELEFSLHATLDARGREVDTAATTGGVTSTMDAILAIKCTQKNATSFLFVMNMFNTEVNVGSGVSNGILVGDDNDNALGEDMYFEQNVDGQITNIWYESDDDPYVIYAVAKHCQSCVLITLSLIRYFVQVKVGAINSLQTKLIPAGTTQTVLESDPVGVHYSVFDGASGTVLQVTKSYTQNDFEKFPDPQLHKSNVQIQGSASAQIHDSGYIQAASVTQVPAYFCLFCPGFYVFSLFPFRSSRHLMIVCNSSPLPDRIVRGGCRDTNPVIIHSFSERASDRRLSRLLVLLSQQPLCRRKRRPDRHLSESPLQWHHASLARDLASAE